MDKSDWEKVNKDLKRDIANLEYLISRADATDAALLGDKLNEMISKFIEARPEIFEKSEVKADNQGASYVKHQSKTMQQLKAHKKDLQRKLLSMSSTLETRKHFWETVRAMSDLKKIEKKKQELQTTSHQEKLFKKNPWEFSKSAVRGDLGKKV